MSYTLKTLAEKSLTVKESVTLPVDIKLLVGATTWTAYESEVSDE